MKSRTDIDFKCSRKSFLYYSLIISLILLLIAGCSPSGGTPVPGLDSGLSVEQGTVKVIGAERTDQIKLGDNVANARDGADIILVSVDVTGDVPLAGKSGALTNLSAGKWVITDQSGGSYSVSGLIEGKLLFEVREPSRGLTLHLGDQISISLDRFLGAVEAVSSQEITPSPTVIRPTSSGLTAQIEQTATALALAFGTPSTSPTTAALSEANVRETAVASTLLEAQQLTLTPASVELSNTAASRNGWLTVQYPADWHQFPFITFSVGDGMVEIGDSGESLTIRVGVYDAERLALQLGLERGPGGDVTLSSPPTSGEVYTFTAERSASEDIAFSPSIDLTTPLVAGDTKGLYFISSEPSRRTITIVEQIPDGRILRVIAYINDDTSLQDAFSLMIAIAKSAKVTS